MRVNPGPYGMRCKYHGKIYTIERLCARVKQRVSSYYYAHFASQSVIAVDVWYRPAREGQIIRSTTGNKSLSSEYTEQRNLLS